jgi:hypothetical protein
MRLLALFVLLVSACGSSSKTHTSTDLSNAFDASVGDLGAPQDISVADIEGPADLAPPCYTNPTTYLEIINACTTAKKFAKSPVLPLEAPDGGRPPVQ